MKMNKNDKYLGTDYYQLTGKHLMGNGIKHEVTPEMLENVKNIEEKKQLEHMNTLMNKNKGCKSYDDKKIVPIGNRVVVLPYDENPYRVPVHMHTSGLIYGDFGTAATYKSQETGEQEAAQRGIWCCQVIAIGPDCKSVVEGEDVYINFTMAAPLPFGGKGYYSITENSIICSIRNKE